MGLVGLAGLFGDTVLLGENEDFDRVAAVAAAACETVDEDLWREGYIGPGSVTGDVDSVGDGACGAMGPASAAVLWNVLVAAPGEVVDVGDVSPVPGSW